MIKKFNFIILFILIFILKLHAQDHPFTCNEYVVCGSTAQISLYESINIARMNYPPLKIAYQELELSKQKYDKALRDMFPNASIKAEHIEGQEDIDLNTPGFIEQNYGLQISQSITEGGKFRNALKNAKLNSKTAQLKISSLNNELEYSISESYYNLVKSILILDIYEKLLKDIKVYDDMAVKLYKSNVITKKDMLASQSMLNQTEYDLRGARLEYQKFLWKWTEAMGLSYTLKRDPYLSLDTDIKDVDLYRCLQKAERFNYELSLQKDAVRAAYYDYKIEASKDKPSLKLEGFYGQSRSYYLNESKDFKEDYQVQLKLEYPFYGNTFSSTGSTQETSPKLGQDDVTHSDNAALEFAILNDLDDKIKQKETYIAYAKAINEEKEKRIKVNNEVREAYFNWEKAILQIKSGEIEVSLNTTDYEIAKINFHDSKIGIQDLMSSRSKLAKAKISFIEAKAFYLITVASMDKLLGDEKAW